MNQKELKELIEFLIEKDIAEFELERGDVKMRMKRSAEPGAAPTPAWPVYAAAPPVTGIPGNQAAPASSPVAPPTSAVPVAAAVPAEETGLHMVRSPIVGTYYESPSPGAPAFVKPGDPVKTGQVLCIVEAMKLMNEIESDATGEIVKCYVANGQPVEYNQPLYAIRTKV